jgi:hypothetical protein
LTPVPEPFHVKLTLYNAAGEAVKHLYEGNSQVAPSTLTYFTVPGPPQGPLPIAIHLYGIESAWAPPPIVWLGDNDNGQPVSNGMYYAKLEVTDSFGKTTALVADIAVLGAVGGNSLVIYNSAGERVRSVGLNNLPTRLVDFSLASGNGGPGAGSGGGLELKLRGADDTEFPWKWDGLNDRGAPVGSGSYTVQLVHHELGSAVVVKSLVVVLLQAPSESLQAALASALLGPNPYVESSAGGLRPVLAWQPLAGTWGRARLYNLAGELVGQSLEVQGTGRIAIDPMPLAGGIYLLEFEILQGQAVLGRRTLKWAVLR